jgi:hypothetical protein
MKHLKTLAFLVFLSAVSVSAQAARGPGAAEAERICDDFSFTNAQVACLRSLQGLYIDGAVPSFCRRNAFQDGKVECLIDLSNILLSEQAERSCLRYSFDSQIQACFKELGEPVRNQLDAIEAAERVSQAISQIDANHPRAARQTLRQLLNRLEGREDDNDAAREGAILSL